MRSCRETDSSYGNGRHHSRQSLLLNTKLCTVEGTTCIIPAPGRTPSSLLSSGKGPAGRLTEAPAAYRAAVKIADMALGGIGKGMVAKML